MDAKPNPAGAPKVDRKRIPMSVPSRRLEVPDMEGYHLYWFVDRNIPRAIQAGYEFVNDREVILNTPNVASSRGVSGNVDLGSHVRVIGGAAEGGGIEYLTLMKIRKEWFTEDQKLLEQRNAQILSAIFRDEQIAGSDTVPQGDKPLRYVKQALFQRPTRK